MTLPTVPGVDLRTIWQVEPSPNIIDATDAFVRSYCVLPENAYLPLAVWSIATHVAGEFDAFPYVSLQSPIKQCGKTRVLEVLEFICCRAWRGAFPSSAALYRMMEQCPTLLLDEVEALNIANANETQQALLAILNAGHRKGSSIPRCAGKDSHLEMFHVYGPKAFAGIGGLPDTLSDRSIVIQLQRRKANQHIKRFLFRRAKAEAAPLQSQIGDWAREKNEDVRIAYEGLPDLNFLSDRDADLWMPLFATCSVASADRLRELKRCALELSGRKQANDTNDSWCLRLLHDIRQVWPEEVARLTTADLIQRLRALPDSSWAECDLNPRLMARWLRPFEITPRQIRIGTITVKGYLRPHLTDAFDRYLRSSAEVTETEETSRALGAEPGE